MNGKQLFRGGDAIVVKFARARVRSEGHAGDDGSLEGGHHGDVFAGHAAHPSTADGPVFVGSGDAPPSKASAATVGYGMHKNNGRPVEGPPGANLFIYHLPQGLTDEDLANAFANFGPVVSAKVYVDKRTGESRGFGFVSYSDPMHASSAIQGMNGFSLGNKKLKVEHKKASRAKNTNPGPRPPAAYGGGPMNPHMYAAQQQAHGHLPPHMAAAYSVPQFPPHYAMYGQHMPPSMFPPAVHHHGSPAYSPSHYYHAAAAYGYPSVQAGLAAAGVTSASSTPTAASAPGAAHSAPQSALQGSHAGDTGQATSRKPDSEARGVSQEPTPAHSQGGAAPTEPHPASE